MATENDNLVAIRDLISEISLKPLDEHVEEYERVHGQLLRVLSEIDGM